MAESYAEDSKWLYHIWSRGK